ncbi:probable BOI-related E3 ubiquitin-protein ligase 3 [Tanacetum coccineum]
MAIQARLYSDSLAFGDDFGGGGNLSQDLLDNNACGLNDFYPFNAQQEQQYQQMQPSFKNQESCFDNMFNKQISTPSRSLAAHIQKENQEIEGLINLQNERLRLVLQAHKKQQLFTILKNYESKSQLLLRQKDEEIKRATSRRIELEEYLRITDVERQRWQMAANETEAMVMNLNKAIDQVSENSKKVAGAEAEDEGSCCYENNDNKKMLCKSCFNEDSCVVMLPCRHLCSCKSCDVFLTSCPVCNMVKKATIQLSNL